jgi:DNA-binding response OmpR family regulator
MLRHISPVRQVSDQRRLCKIHIMTTIPDEPATGTPLPRIALFLTDPRVSLEVQEILRTEYSSLMLISEIEKLDEFHLPLVVLVDNIKDAASVRGMKAQDQARIIIISSDEDSELIGAAFEAGADEYLRYPFAPEEVLQKTKNVLSEVVA